MRYFFFATISAEQKHLIQILIMIREIRQEEIPQRPKYGLTFLVLNSNIRFEKTHVFKILHLEQLNVFHQRLYHKLASVVDMVAASLNKEHNLSTLSLYPVTDIVGISWFVADYFPCLFYDYDNLNTLKSESILLRKDDSAREASLSKVPRYNQMWIITYLLKIAYEKYVERVTFDKFVEDASRNKLNG